MIRRIIQKARDLAEDFSERLDEASEEIDEEPESGPCPNCVERAAILADCQSKVQEYEGLLQVHERDWARYRREMETLAAERDELRGQVNALGSRDETIAAVLEVLRTFRARAEQQLGEIEQYTRDWDDKTESLVTAAHGATRLQKELEAFIEKLRGAGKKKTKAT